MSKTETPIACSLSGASFKGRIEAIEALFHRALRSSRREGNALHLSFAAEAREELAHLVELERVCCGFLDFELRSNGGSVDLTITAPDGNAAADLLADFAQAATVVEQRF